jgi:hypothetical protein
MMYHQKMLSAMLVTASCASASNEDFVSMDLGSPQECAVTSATQGINVTFLENVSQITGMVFKKKAIQKGFIHTITLQCAKMRYAVKSQLKKGTKAFEISRKALMKKKRGEILTTVQKISLDLILPTPPVEGQVLADFLPNDHTSAELGATDVVVKMARLPSELRLHVSGRIQIKYSEIDSRPCITINYTQARCDNELEGNDSAPAQTEENDDGSSDAEPFTATPEEIAGFLAAHDAGFSQLVRQDSLTIVLPKQGDGTPRSVVRGVLSDDCCSPGMALLRKAMKKHGCVPIRIPLKYVGTVDSEDEQYVILTYQTPRPVETHQQGE